jgi:hypothetical protein
VPSTARALGLDARLAEPSLEDAFVYLMRQHAQRPPT